MLSGRSGFDGDVSPFSAKSDYNDWLLGRRSQTLMIIRFNLTVLSMSGNAADS